MLLNDGRRQHTELLGRGFAGPAVELDCMPLTNAQRELCGRGLDERQLRMLKAQVGHKHV
jgi:hypothetical protein